VGKDGNILISASVSVMFFFTIWSRGKEIMMCAAVGCMVCYRLGEK